VIGYQFPEIGYSIEANGSIGKPKKNIGYIKNGELSIENK